MTANLPAWLKFDWQSLFQPSVWGALFSTLLQYALLFLLLIFLFRLLRLMGELVRGSRLRTGVPLEKEKTFSGGAQLRVLDDAQQLLRQTVFPVRASLSIGRGEHNDIVVNDPLEFVFLYLNLVIQLDLLYKLVFELILVSFLIKNDTRNLIKDNMCQTK